MTGCMGLATGFCSLAFFIGWKPLLEREGLEMRIPEARQFVGRDCWVSWTDRLGQQQSKVLRVEELQFLPLYGAYIIGEHEEVRLDKVTQIQPVD